MFLVLVCCKQEIRIHYLFVPRGRNYCVATYPCHHGASEHSRPVMSSGRASAETGTHAERQSRGGLASSIYLCASVSFCSLNRRKELCGILDGPKARGLGAENPLVPRGVPMGGKGKRGKACKRNRRGRDQHQGLKIRMSLIQPGMQSNNLVSIFMS